MVMPCLPVRQVGQQRAPNVLSPIATTALQIYLFVVHAAPVSKQLAQGYLKLALALQGVFIFKTHVLLIALLATLRITHN
jgi:hypothetical protein